MFILIALLTNISEVVIQNDTILQLYRMDEVVVTATKVEQPVWKVGKSLTIITEDEIKRERTIVNALRNLAGLDVAEAGAFGGVTSVFLRGANSEHTLVLVDGIKLNDPISPTKSFDFAGLTIDNVERIEIVRGPQSALYGSDAIGGVINIITKKGSEGINLNASAECGTHNTFLARTGISGKSGKLSYSLGGSSERSDGISKAAGDEAEKDGHNLLSFSSNFGLNLLENIDIGLIFMYINRAMDTDDGGFMDNPNRQFNSTDWIGNIWTSHQFNKFWNHKITIGMRRIARGDSSLGDESNAEELFYSWFEGAHTKIGWQNNFSPLHSLNIVAGIEYEDDEGESFLYSKTTWGEYEDKFERERIINKSCYLALAPSYKTLFFNSGGRLEFNEEFGRHFTWQVSLAYLFPNVALKLKTNYGTGFKAPTIYQIYSQYGSSDLKPEKTRGYDVGIEKFFHAGKMEVLFFHNDFDEQIIFNFDQWKYKNSKGGSGEGIEFNFDAEPFANMSLKAGYTGTYSRDNKGNELMRRPAHKYRVILNYMCFKRLDLNLKYVRVGKREDYAGMGGITLPLYTKYDISSSLTLTEMMKLRVRVENLLNEQYQEVYGYNTLGRSVFVGIDFSYL